LLLSKSFLSKIRHQTKVAGSRPFQCLESGFISPNAERRDFSGSVKFFENKETFQQLSIPFDFQARFLEFASNGK
jgi:hypothetical protein